MMSLLYAIVAAPILGLLIGVLAWNVAQKRAEMTGGDA